MLTFDNFRDIANSETSSKASNIKFLNKNSELEYGYSTSWGVSTRLIGALVMVHGDERGLRMPPNVAPIQVVIIPIASKKEGVVEKCVHKW